MEDTYKHWKRLRVMKKNFAGSNRRSELYRKESRSMDIWSLMQMRSRRRMKYGVILSVTLHE